MSFQKILMLCKVMLRPIERKCIGFVKTMVDIYQGFISPFIGHSCRYYPSCSNYFLEAIDKKGIFSGFFCGGLRILRCNPFFPGGFDPVTKTQDRKLNTENKTGNK